MGHFDYLVDAVKATGLEVDFAGEQSLESIAILEREIGHNLPPSYRTFLREYGAGGTFGSFLSGIYNDPNLENEGSTLADTRRARRDFGIANHLIVV